MQGPQRVDIRSNAQVAYRRRTYQILGAVPGTAIGINNDRPLARKVLQQPSPDRLHHLPDRVAVVVSWHSDEDVHFADIDQLTDEVIGKDGGFWQEQLLR